MGAIINSLLSKLGIRGGSRLMTWLGDDESPGFAINLNELSGVRDAYNKCSPVATIANRLASSMANGAWWIVDESNNDVSKVHKNVADLLKNPNPMQSTIELVKQIDVYRNLYGVAYVYAFTPSGYNVGGAATIWPINPERINVVYKNNNLYHNTKIENIIEKYIISVDTHTIDVEPKHILRLGDASSGAFKYSSRLQSLEYEIKNICQAQEAVYSLNRDRGAQGIITNKSRDVSGNIPLTKKEKDDIQEEYKKKYGIMDRHSKILISDADLGWQQMTFDVKSLMLFEGIKENLERISDSFNYPFELLANQKGTTFANRSEAIKYLYQDNIIPNANIYAEKFTKFFGLENAKIVIDFSHVEYLREAEKERADALFKLSASIEKLYKLGVITREEARSLYLDLDEKPQNGTMYEGEATN